MNKPDMSGVHDFDFLHGKWRVIHRQLSGRLCNATEWDTAAALDIVRPAFCGLGNIGRFMREIDGQPYEGAPIRLYNPNDGLWRIYWLDTRDQRMEPPVVGRFRDGQGVFLGNDELRGRAIKVRFVWSGITTSTARWEQAFSDTGGACWEVNSIMEFERDDSLPDNPSFPLVGF